MAAYTVKATTGSADSAPSPFSQYLYNRLPRHAFSPVAIGRHRQLKKKNHTLDKLTAVTHLRTGLSWIFFFYAFEEFLRSCLSFLSGKKLVFLQLNFAFHCGRYSRIRKQFRDQNIGQKKWLKKIKLIQTENTYLYLASLQLLYLDLCWGKKHFSPPSPFQSRHSYRLID